MVEILIWSYYPVDLNLQTKEEFINSYIDDLYSDEDEKHIFTKEELVIMAEKEFEESEDRFVNYEDYKKLEDEHRQILQDLKKEIINNSHYIANFKEIFKKYGVD